MKRSVLSAVAVIAGCTFGASAQLLSIQSNGDDNLYSIDINTGVATSLGAMDFGDAEGLTDGPGGQFFAIGGSVEEFWNVTTPPGTLVGPTGTRGGTDAGLDYFGGVMYNMNGAGGGSELYTIDINTGAATLVGTSSEFADNIAVAPSGVAYAVDAIFTDSLYTVDLSTGAMTLVGDLGLGNISVQLGTTFIGDDLYALDSGGTLYTISTSTGAARTLFGVTDPSGSPLSGWEGLAYVPAPSAAAILALGGLVATRRRR